MKSTIFKFLFILFAGNGVLGDWLGTSIAWAQIPNNVAKNNSSLLPYPKQINSVGLPFELNPSVTISLDKNASDQDKFAASELQSRIKALTGLQLRITSSRSKRSISFQRQKDMITKGSESYQLASNQNRITIKASEDAGLFYGTQTLLQLIQKDGQRYIIPGLVIHDWPDTPERAVHYDTKHHQDKRSYVESLIKELASYKINMLIWEWEDKFEYPSHPEIGAPGAFTLKEMQEITRYAKKYHIQIVPLVQGLGHVSFILKWPQFAHLREIPASNFEFCPLKNGTYDLLEDLWKDAMEATPGSEFIHIGSDETYELGACAACKKKEAEIGKSGLYHYFIDKSAQRIEGSGRSVMTWEAPMGWDKGRLEVYHTGMKQDKPVKPRKGILLTESYDYETSDLKYAKQAKSMGHPVYAYDPNPGIEQLFLPYFFTKNGKGVKSQGSLENSYNFLKKTMGKDVFDGVVRTSWDDSGLPMQAWMLSFATTATFSWNANSYSLPEFTNAFFNNRYGQASQEIDSLYYLLNEGAYFYMESFERRVWAWGDIGKTHLPDLPRGDAIEYDPFWNKRYADRLATAEEFVIKMNKAIQIGTNNLKRDIQNKHDIEVFLTLAKLIRHTAYTYQDLSKVEFAIKEAHQNRYLDVNASLVALKKAETIIANSLTRRETVYTNLLDTWQTTMLPKGMSTQTKHYFFEQDRTRHFANRTSDMTYLIYDEQLLNMEGYLEELRDYIQFFQQRFIK
ncbi:beta-N-acetylhexosaminidase [Dyadobacter tibetensis]|uniref:beta-N-acetylhexosaminidase n=1 Tax=Dyadobacter tibetensis TaxID=1211851 RepID=UPI00047024A2|nr:beta-N-acetylhexosaminidase [Dyadobacter tibetensis]